MNTAQELIKQLLDIQKDTVSQIKMQTGACSLFISLSWESTLLCCFKLFIKHRKPAFL